MKQIVVIGDVHHHLWLAVEGLERIEAETGVAIDQVFTVGDLGLFLHEDDWRFLTGPSKYRKPEDSQKIREAWDRWRWPLSAIAGNHEPFHRLRSWDAAYFGNKLKYTDAGELGHEIPGLRAAGLSGIYNPAEAEFVSAIEREKRKLPRAGSWPEMVAMAETNKIPRSRLTYYKEFEVDLLKLLVPRPDILLLHDWPVAPSRIKEVPGRRPEMEVVESLQPAFVCCGHHHTSAAFVVGGIQVRALNIIGGRSHSINPGWACIFDWEGSGLQNARFWPPIP